MSVSHETQRKSKLTYEHYTQLPDDGNRHEIVDGVHYMNPAPIFPIIKLCHDTFNSNCIQQSN